MYIPTHHQPTGPVIQPLPIPSTPLCDQAVQAKAADLGLTPDDYRLHCFQSVALDGTMAPRELIDLGLAERPIIVFDIDHTLVHSVEASLVKKEAPKTKGRAERINVGKSILLKIVDGYEFLVFIRYGATEMLEFLSEFCTLYVYSHGIKSYIDGVLKVLDPDERFFLERDKRVLAPKDAADQKAFTERGKNIADFGDPDLAKSDWLIIDDQLVVVPEKGILSLSLNFL